jgi:hypothetical protein
MVEVAQMWLDDTATVHLNQPQVFWKTISLDFPAIYRLELAISGKEILSIAMPSSFPNSNDPA